MYIDNCTEIWMRIFEHKQIHEAKERHITLFCWIKKQKCIKKHSLACSDCNIWINHARRLLEEGSKQW